MCKRSRHRRRHLSPKLPAANATPRSSVPSPDRSTRRRCRRPTPTPCERTSTTRRFARTASRRASFAATGAYFVNTDGPDGKLTDYEVKYTFGVEPLQQYLVELPGGRLQALPIAWDTRAKRWFHLYPGEHIDHKDVLHWTRTAQNWNTMCAACHSMQVHKNYDAATDVYQTTVLRGQCRLSELSRPRVRPSCLGERQQGGAGDARSRGFIADVSARSGRAQVDACAYCHALRSTLTPEYPVGAPLLDHALPVGLDSTPLLQRWPAARGSVHPGLVAAEQDGARRGWSVPIATIRTPAKRRRRATRLCTSCHNATGAAARPHIDTTGSSAAPTTRRRITTTPSRSRASNATPPSAPTWWSTGAWITHSAFRARTSPSRRRRRTPAICATRTVTRNGRRPRSRNGTDLRRRAEVHYGQAFAAARDGRPGAAEALQKAGRGPRAAGHRPRRCDRAARRVSQPPRARTRHVGAGRRRRAGAHRRSACGDGDRPGDGLREVPARLSDPLRGVRIEAAHALAPRSHAFRLTADWPGMQRDGTSKRPRRRTPIVRNRGSVSRRWRWQRGTQPGPSARCDAA